MRCPIQGRGWGGVRGGWQVLLHLLRVSAARRPLLGTSTSPGGKRSLFQATCLRPLHTPHYPDGLPKPVPRAATLSLVNQRPAAPLDCRELILLRSRFAPTKSEPVTPQKTMSRSPGSGMQAAPWSGPGGLQVSSAAQQRWKRAPTPCQSEDTLRDRNS